LVELAQRTEELGYTGLWYPEAVGYESFGLGGFLLAHTKKLIIASGISNIYARDATAAKQGQHTLAKLHGGRFLLGLGFPMYRWSRMLAAINIASLWQRCALTWIAWIKRQRSHRRWMDHHRQCWRRSAPR
jgi:hypothetical protein